MDFDDIFSNFGDIFGDMFGFNQQPRRSGPTPQRGHDIVKNVSISLKDAYLGFSTTISYYHAINCSGCNGQGVKNKSDISTCATCKGAGKVRYQQGFFAQIQHCSACQGQGFSIKNPCTDCKGQSRKQHYENLQVKIPQGIFDGAEIKYRGKGDAEYTADLQEILHYALKFLQTNILNVKAMTLLAQQC